MAAAITVPIGTTITKHPAAQKVYQILWERFLAAGQVITNSTWTITGPDAVLVYDNDSHDGVSITQLRLKVGTNGATYVVENTITFGSAPVQTETQGFKVSVTKLA